MNLASFTSLMSRLQIKHRDTGQMVPFRFFPNQTTAIRMLSEQYESKRKLRAIFLKSRRVTVSSLMDALLFAHCLESPHRENLIVAHVKDTSEGLFRVPRDLANALNQRVECCDVLSKRIVVRHGRDTSLLDIATAGSVASGRGLTISGLHLSECAQYPGQDSFLSLLPAVGKGDDTMIFLESTAFGKTGLGANFYEFWSKAMQHKNDYIAIFLGFLADPACVADESFAEDAPATDMERELMAPPFNATRAQIAWVRIVLESECQGYEKKFCVAADTRVSTEQAGISCIGIGHSGNTGSRGVISKCWSNGVKPVVRVATRCGYEVRTTPDHKFETVRHGWQDAFTLQGRQVRLLAPSFSHSYQTVDAEGWGTVRIDERWGRFLGYFMGDGSITGGNRSGISVSLVGDGKDQDVRDLLLADTEILFGKTMACRLAGHSVSAWELRTTMVRFKHLARAMGFFREVGRPLRIVKVPEVIFHSARSVVREFLRGIFEADGSSSNCMVRLYSTSEELLKGVQLLLLGFSITCWRSGSWIILKGEENNAFRSEIGFLGHRKNSYPPLPWKRPLAITMTDRVTSVVDDGVAEVFDLNVEQSHKFDANGFSVHNCQEYPWTPSVAFQSTNDPVFTPDEIKWAEKGIQKPHWTGHMEWHDSRPWFVEARDGAFSVWRKPEEGHRYFIGMDAAVGVESGDFGAIAIWDGSTGEQVAEYAARVTPEVLAYMLNAMGRWYNKALLNGELTGNSGREVLRLMRDTHRYPNLALWKGKDDKFAQASRSGTSRATSLWWEMTSYSRRKLMDCYRMAIRGAAGKNKWAPLDIYPADFSATVRSQSLWQQMADATYTEGMRWEVEHGHDDLLVANMLAVITYAQYPVPKLVSAAVVRDTGPSADDELRSLLPNVQSDVSTSLQRHYKKAMAASKRAVSPLARRMGRDFVADRLAGI